MISRLDRRTKILFIVSLLLLLGSHPGRAQSSVYSSAERLSSTAWGQRAETPFRVNADAAPVPPGEGPSDGSAENGAPSAEIRPGEEVSAVPKRFQYALRLSMRGTYDDNIYLRRTNQAGDFYFAIEPGITLGFGDIVGPAQNHVRLDYAPSIFLYADHPDADGVQHLIRLDAQYSFGHLTLNVLQTVEILSGARQNTSLGTGVIGANTGPSFNVDAGGNTDVNIYSTQANLSYDLTGKTFLTGSLGYNATEYDVLISSESLTGNVFINYNYSPKLVLGVGGSAGYNWVGGTNPNQSFEQINARVSYLLTGKVSVNASGGVEFRQFEDNLRGGDYISPVYELGASYQPFDGTSINLTGSRRTLNSAVLTAQDYASTNITVSARQRFLRRFYFGLTIGYENADYFGTVEFVDSSRSDDYFFVQPSVDFTITRFWTAGAYYLHREDNSSAERFSFVDNQVGLRTSLTF